MTKKWFKSALGGVLVWPISWEGWLITVVLFGGWYAVLLLYKLPLYAIAGMWVAFSVIYYVFLSSKTKES